MKNLLLCQEPSCTENNMELGKEGTMEAYRQKIIQRVNNIDSIEFLKFIWNMLNAFADKGGDVKRKLLKKLFKILSAVDDVWILNQIYKFSVNMTKQEDLA